MPLSVGAPLGVQSERHPKGHITNDEPKRRLKHSDHGSRVTIHHEFAKWAGSEMGDEAAIDGAKSLAMTAIDYFADEGLRTRTREVFEAFGG